MTTAMAMPGDTAGTFLVQMRIDEQVRVDGDHAPRSR